MSSELALRKEIVDPQRPPHKFIWHILCITAVSLDFWFFYIPVVNDNKKCISFDLNLAITVSVFRLLCDLFYFMHFNLRMLTDVFVSTGENINSYVIHTLRVIIDLVQGNDFRKRVWEYLSPSHLVDLLAIFPLPQLVILFIIPRMRGSKILDALDLLKYSVFIQFVPRIIRIYPWTLGKLPEATLAFSAFNLLLYMFAGHVFGALWYFAAIERETECWKKACINDSGCGRGSFDCDDSIGEDKFLNGICPIKIRNTTIHDFGIFHDALQSGIVEVTDFPQKFLHCFRWGLRNLSCFGQNLQPSSDSWENFFVILVTISGLLLLLFLFANMQIYLQPKSGKSKEMSTRMREMNEWMPIQKLSKPLQQQLNIYQRYIGRKPDSIDIEIALSSLPKELSRNIKRELCLELLKNVEGFKKLDDAILDALCDCVKMSFYFKYSHIILEGEPIYEMLFVVEGKIWTYTSRERAGGSTNNLSRDKSNKVNQKDHLAEADFWGEELVAWALHDRSLSNIPMSVRTVQTLTDVEAFTLTAEDLKNVFIEHQVFSSTKLNLKHSMKSAASVIQLAWRRRHTRRKSTQ